MTPVVSRILDGASERFDVIRAFDPGANQALLAAGVMAGVSATIGVVYLFVQATHALWAQPPAGVHLPPAQLAMLAAQHHGATLLAMLIGGIVGMLSAFAVVDTEPRPLLLTMALSPAAMLASIALSVQLLSDRTLGILVMAVVMGVGSYLPRFTPRIGPRAFTFGQMLFVGYLLGFLSRGAITTGDLGWIAAILWVAAAVNVVLKLAVFIPLRRGASARTLRACRARARAVVAAAADLYATEDPHRLARVRRRLARRLNRLNEAALIADALLEADAPAAHAAHLRSFDHELNVQNIGRLADALHGAELPAEVRGAIARGLADARESQGQPDDRCIEVLRRFGCDPDAVRAHPLESGRALRLAVALEEWALDRDGDREARSIAPEPAGRGEFEPALTLMFGNLPGAALVSQEAAAPAGSRRARLRIGLPAQTAIRLTIAVVAAASIGSVLSERRFYWAVLAVFISFIGTSTSGEQLFKALNRVGGTVVGILVGSLLAHAVGASTWSLLVVVLALGGGIYFMRASYALMVIGITITVSQLYVQLGEYSNSLLVLRLEETAIGAAVAALAALVVFPVRTMVATRIAARDYYDRLAELLDAILVALAGGEDTRSLTALSRALDGAAHQLRSAALPLTLTPFRRDTVQNNLMLFGQASHHARNLAGQFQRDVDLRDEIREQGAATLRGQQRLVRALRGRLADTIGPPAFAELTGDRTDPSLTQELRRHVDLLSGGALDGTPDERQFARHLARLDETLAELGDNLTRSRPLPDDRGLPGRLMTRVLTPR